MHELRALIGLAAGRLDVALSAIVPAMDLAPAEPTIWYLAGCLALATHSPRRSVLRFLRSLDLVETRQPAIDAPESFLLGVTRTALDVRTLGASGSAALEDRCVSVQPLLASIVRATGRSLETCAFLDPFERGGCPLACDRGVWRMGPHTAEPTISTSLASPANSAWRCLLVDDSPDSLYLLKAVLRERGGLDPILATSGMQALSQMSGPGFDVAIVNHTMPRMNGRELIARMRLRGYSGPIAVTSAMITDLDKIAYLSAPLCAVAVLELPIQIQSLRGLVDEMLLSGAAVYG